MTVARNGLPLDVLGAFWLLIASDSHSCVRLDALVVMKHSNAVFTFKEYEDDRRIARSHAMKRWIIILRDADVLLHCHASPHVRDSRIHLECPLPMLRLYLSQPPVLHERL